ncbi:unnamed protein product [Musa acuminata subsp. burmannicoides]
MANPYESIVMQPRNTEGPPHDLDLRHSRKLMSLIRREKYDELRMECQKTEPVNFMEDPLLSVVIACKKTSLAMRLIRDLTTDQLMQYNFKGDTALHVAATVGDCQVARELFTRKGELVGVRNHNMETPLHKAALYGNWDMFFRLLSAGSDLFARKEDGNNVLHCAIMGNTPELAMEIARRAPVLNFLRNADAVTPLQLMVTIPELFRSQTPLSPLESLLYDWIPLERQDSGVINPGDVEKRVGDTEEEEEDVGNGSKIPSHYSTLFDLLELLKIPVSPTMERLEKLKRHHKTAMGLIELLATSGYFDFLLSGRSGIDSSDPMKQVPAESVMVATLMASGEPDTETERLETEDSRSKREDASATQGQKNGKRPDIRWHESPLITGAKMGLHDFVRKILQVCPHSATYLDTHGTSVLQAAIKYGRKEIVETIVEMTQGDLPVLPAWLLSSIDAESRNTILHFASDKTPYAQADAVQLQDDLKWFEKVAKIVPKELANSRNSEEKTAQELFAEKHQQMFKGCRNQLIDMGKTCSGLLAAVVFASSFSIPGEKDPKTGNPVYFDMPAFKVFSHAYVIGLSCAVTSLVLFLSLVISPYSQRQFRLAIPVKYFFAILSFAMALLALMVSFTCNIFLQIYGGQPTTTRDLLPLVLELTVFPTLCLLALVYYGANLFPSFRRIWT